MLEGTRDRELSQRLIPAIIQGASGGTGGFSCWDNAVNVTPGDGNRHRSFCVGDGKYLVATDTKILG